MFIFRERDHEIEEKKNHNPHIQKVYFLLLLLLFYISLLWFI